MGYQLLWLEVLGFNLLLAALVTACSARLARRDWQILWPGLIVGLNLLNAVGGLVGYYLIITQRVVFAWSGYFISLQLLSLAGAAVVLWRGLRLTKTDAPAPAARSWPRSRLAIATVIALGLSFMTFQDLDSTVKSEVSALRAEAGALALSVAPQPVPDADNAAMVYEKAFEAMPAEDSFPEGWKNKIWAQWHKNPESCVTDADFNEYLKRHETAIAFFRLAAAKPACNIDRNYARPSFTMLLPELTKMRQGARLLAKDARLCTKRGNLVGAAQDIAAIRSMAEHMRSDPLIISLMVAIAIDGIADTTIEHWLAAGQVQTLDSLDIIRPTQAVSLRRSLARAFRMEEAVGLATFADLSSGTLSPRSISDMSGATLGNEETSAAWRVFFLRGELDSYRQQLGRSQELASYSYRESQKRWAYLDSSAHAQEPMGIIVRLLLPVLGKIAESTARAEARTRLADLGVAMTRHKLKHGSYPATLDALDAGPVSLLTLDPFDGQPLRMVAADGGLVLYSVGPDGKDDGGKEYDASTKLGDITFCLGAAYKARRK